ncbi:MAG: DUF4190 domain-containing protein [Aquiluna sp.]|jgi:hypothetical protein|tara:strand:- start:177 stop:611 length:435 start_codon:yes stop_codon:yes gene_type:complete
MTDKVPKKSKDSSAAKDQESAEQINPEQAPEVAAVNRQRFDWRSLNSLAVVSLATALTSIGAVAAIITGHIALAQIKRSDQNGRKLAITGVTIGYVTVGLWVIFGILAVSVRAFVEPGSFGHQPFGQDLFELQRGFGGMRGHDD